MNQYLSDNSRAEAEVQIELLSERVAELEEENRLLEEVLRRNSRMFEALLTNGQDGIVLTGPDRRIVKVIKGLAGMNGAALTGQKIDSLVIPEDRQAIVDAYGKLLDGRCGKIRIPVRMPQEDGSLVLFSATLTDMLDNPNVFGIVWNYSTYPFLE